MSAAQDRLTASLQRNLAAAEIERLRLVDALEEMRLRAEQAEARIASVSGVTREELVKATHARCVAAAERALHGNGYDAVTPSEVYEAVRDCDHTPRPEGLTPSGSSASPEATMRGSAYGVSGRSSP